MASRMHDPATERHAHENNARLGAQPLKADRLPQYQDRVEVTKSHCFGTVMEVDLKERPIYLFFVRLDDGYGGWYTAEELRVVGIGAASNPACYQ